MVMTTKHHKKMAAIFDPKPVFADNRYGLDVLDSTREELMPTAIRRTAKGEEVWIPTRSGGRKKMLSTRRDSEPADPWLSPAKSEAVRALLIQIGAAQNSSTATNYPVELDLEMLCKDAELEPVETEVVLLVAEGWVQCQISEWLEINQATVSRRLSSGRRKLLGWLPVLVAHKLQTA